MGRRCVKIVTVVKSTMESQKLVSGVVCWQLLISQIYVYDATTTRPNMGIQFHAKGANENAHLTEKIQRAAAGDYAGVVLNIIERRNQAQVTSMVTESDRSE